jgi:hypothetical protein
LKHYLYLYEVEIKKNMKIFSKLFQKLIAKSARDDVNLPNQEDDVDMHVIPPASEETTVTVSNVIPQISLDTHRDTINSVLTSLNGIIERNNYLTKN